MSTAWVTEVWRFIGLMLVALLVGVALDHVLAAAFLGLGGYLAWHLVNLYRLERWLRDSRRFNPPNADGIWAEVFHHYYHLQRRNRERKRRLAGLISEFRESTAAMPDGAVVLGGNWDILWFNAAAARLLGLRVPHDTGQRIVNLIRDPRFVQYVVAGEFNDPVEIGSPKERGHVLSLHLVPYGGSQHLLLVRDVTRLHRLEQLRRDFVANASHELRSPLTVIAGYLDTLSDDPVAQKELGAPLVEMRQQAERMRAIVDDLLVLSRLESEGDEAAMERVGVVELLTRIRDEALPLRKTDQLLELELDSGADLLGVENELHSAISNLVVNAINYTPPGGRITLRWETGADGGRLSVRDTGIGIPAEQIPRITERFYRVDMAPARSTGGTGLGLAICKHALQRHGGRLEIESAPGEGSTFTCVFPAERVYTP